MESIESIREKAVVPNPGSPEAKAQGCLCPVMDNAHGRGYRMPGQFVMVHGCPLHAPADDAEFVRAIRHAKGYE